MVTKDAASTWTAGDAQVDFDKLLTAAVHIPQFVERDGQRFVVRALPLGRSAKELLGRGGPLDQADFPTAD